MRTYAIIISVIVILFICLAFIVKSHYYYFPYPNLIEYLLSFVLLILAFTLNLKRKISLKVKLLTGSFSIAIVIGGINLLNHAYEWHPLNLNLPFSRSQSFEVDFEPYEWEIDSPDAHGYSDKKLADYFSKAKRWERLRGLLVVKGNKLIIEKYFAGTTKYSAFNVHSVTKSITSALVGLAIQHNYVASDNDLILPFFPEYEGYPFGKFKRALSIKHLLSMRGGWAGGDGHQTVEKCILAEHLYRMPDTQFKYFSGSQNVLSAIITKSTKQSTKEFADRHLLEPLGIRNGFWRKVDGYYCGGDESYYTARDLARFGKLYLDQGNINGKQLLDSSWIQKTFANYTVSSNDFRSLEAYSEVGYGLSWWIFKNGNQMIYAARGKGGQHIMVIPDKQIVLVILQEWNPLTKNSEVEDKLLGELLEILLVQTDTNLANARD